MVQAQSITHTVVYTYNGGGVRRAMAVDGVVTYWMQDTDGLEQVLIEHATDGVTLYLLGLSRLAQVEGSSAEWFLGDGLGSMRQLVDDDGAAVLAQSYDPYGLLLAQSGTGSSGYGFTGEQGDPTGLVYLRARYYSPALGRFLSLDPWQGSIQQPRTLHKYTFAWNNPIAFADHTGLGGPEWWEEMVQNPAWREVLFESAGRHNKGTLLSNEQFVALMVAIIRSESAGLRSTHVPYHQLIWEKSKEIIYNRVNGPMWLSGRQIAGQTMPAEYQTEGLANVGYGTILHLQEGLVPLPEHGKYLITDLRVYDYTRHLRPMPGGYPFPSMTMKQKTSWNAANFWLSSSLCTVRLSIFATRSLRQDQNIEYLAANLEAGAIRAKWEGVEATAEVLSWWHHRGIVRIMTDDELMDPGWRKNVREIEGEAREYWTSQISWKIPQVEALLQGRQ